MFLPTVHALGCTGSLNRYVADPDRAGCRCLLGGSLRGIRARDVTNVFNVAKT